MRDLHLEWFFFYWFLSYLIHQHYGGFIFTGQISSLNLLIKLTVGISPNLKLLMETAAVVYSYEPKLSGWSSIPIKKTKHNTQFKKKQREEKSPNIDIVKPRTSYLRFTAVVFFYYIYILYKVCYLASGMKIFDCLPTTWVYGTLQAGSQSAAGKNLTHKCKSGSQCCCRATFNWSKSSGLLRAFL